VPLPRANFQVQEVKSKSQEHVVEEAVEEAGEKAGEKAGELILVHPPRANSQFQLEVKSKLEEEKEEEAKE